MLVERSLQFGSGGLASVPSRLITHTKMMMLVWVRVGRDVGEKQGREAEERCEGAYKGVVRMRS